MTGKTQAANQNEIKNQDRSEQKSRESPTASKKVYQFQKYSMKFEFHFSPI